MQTITAPNKCKEVSELPSILLKPQQNAKASLKKSVPDDVGFELILETESLDEETAQQVLDDVQHYVEIRLKGHSRPYAMWLALNKETPWPQSLQGIRARLENVKQNVAFPWIDPELHDCIAIPVTKANKDYLICYVVDGDLAWVHWANLNSTPSRPSSAAYPFDALELNPAIAPIFHSVFNRMKANGRIFINEKQEQKLWWPEFKTKIKAKTGLKWRAPSELSYYR